MDLGRFFWDDFGMRFGDFGGLVKRFLGFICNIYL